MSTRTFIMTLLSVMLLSTAISALVVKTMQHAKQHPQCVKERWL